MAVKVTVPNPINAGTKTVEHDANKIDVVDDHLYVTKIGSHTEAIYAPKHWISAIDDRK